MTLEPLHQADHWTVKKHFGLCCYSLFCDHIKLFLPFDWNYFYAKFLPSAEIGMVYHTHWWFPLYFFHFKFCICIASWPKESWNIFRIVQIVPWPTGFLYFPFTFILIHNQIPTTDIWHHHLGILWPYSCTQEVGCPELGNWEWVRKQTGSEIMCKAQQRSCIHTDGEEEEGSVAQCHAIASSKLWAYVLFWHIFWLLRSIYI